MTGREIIKEILKEKQVKYVDLNKMQGSKAYSSTVNLFDESKSKDFSIGVLREYASLLGYKVVVVPKWGVTDEKVISYDD